MERRRSTLKWLLLPITCIAAIFIWSNLLHHDSARAAGDASKKQTSASLQVFNQDGKPVGECPLKHTEVKAEVSGFISRVTVTQNFENPFTDKIEAIYVFPLPHAAAVDDLTMVIGDRTIKGKIMRREEAQAAYANAKQTGRIAALLDQERSNVFTQQVANIMPGHQIRVTISYVETLKYEDGAYEWSFPMVVAPRYNAAAGASEQANDQTASRLSPPAIADGMRAGHDISLEINLDAGVPIVAVNSETHETELQEIDEKHAVVRLKDRATIPNKDFVLTYRVAGDIINDAVLAHRSERGGFFTLILQPPQRVAPQDVMPKEIVFVLDTSGSMYGFPLDTAKQAMQLALDKLNPHDTFNLITFSGDTEILFPDPVPATPENLQRAKKFLETREGNGGTEMMKAIKAALDPSDSQHHIRLACFLTDGQVSNETEILAEVQRHPKARVFAMGFGSAPNRALLDKMAQYGRGEIDYVPESGISAPFARRFSERVRNPLLTDISIDWGNLPVTEVYPKLIPDLFSARPLVVSGRYSKGAKGTIRLTGKIAGQDFVREIPVELPELEEDNAALANVWARRRIEDLVAEQRAVGVDPVTHDQKREEITELGLTFKLMTQYTSFVAIDDMIFTGAEEPRRVDVPVHRAAAGLASTMETVSVTSSCVLLSTDLTYTSAFAPRTLQDLPLQGRSLYSFVPLTSGSGDQYSAFNISRNRQSTNFVLDGVNANFGIAQGGESPGASASGNTPALTASGGANGIVTLAATQEIAIKTSPIDPEYGRVAGPQVHVTSSAGTNEFHGSAFHFFGNDALDANDWFANNRGLNKPPKRFNLFGGTFGGAIHRDQTFFFGSYEGMRLRQPVVGITDVPSLSSRAMAPPSIRPFLDAFPVPSGVSRADGFAEFAASFANPARHDVGSIRLDHMFRDNSSVRGRYNFADSSADTRGANGFSLNTTNRIQTRAQTITASLTQMFSPTHLLDLSANYSHLRIKGSYLPDQFGDAVIPANLFPSSFIFNLNSRNSSLMTGDETSSVQRQFNLLGTATILSGNHSIRFGADFRRLSPTIGVRSSEQNVFFDGMGQAIDGIAARVNRIDFSASQRPVFHTLALFAQDQWKQSPRLTLLYGLRWELAPPPSSDNVLAVDQVNDPASINTLAPGSRPWNTTFVNFAPRAGFAYEILQGSNRELLLRGGITILYDTGQGHSGDVFAGSIPFISGSAIFNSPFPVSLPPVTAADGLPLIAFDPELKLPYTINWHVSLQQSLGRSQAIEAVYAGSSGKRLLHTQAVFDQNPDFSFLRLVTNRGSSDYHKFQLNFQRRLTSGLGAVAFYTLSKSSDNVSDDSSRSVIMASLDPRFDRGPSDFDIRQQLGGFITYDLPAVTAKGIGNKISRNWSIDSIFTARSAKPLNVLQAFPTSFGLAYVRPNTVDGEAPFIFDPAAPGGRRIKAAAFIPTSELLQGDFARNSLRGFSLYQIDLGLRRKFYFTERFQFQLQADAFNIFNHANFEDPLGNDLVIGNKLAFGQSASLSGRSVSGGGFGSFYGAGGARSLRFSVKLIF